MDESYRFLGERKVKKIRLAAMNMWKAFGTSTRHHARKRPSDRKAPVRCDDARVANSTGRPFE